VEGTMAMVKTASMLFGGGANQRSASIFRQGSRLILEFVLLMLLSFHYCLLSLSSPPLNCNSPGSAPLTVGAMYPPSTSLLESMENYSGGALTPPVMSSKKTSS
jgi:hypothetical protein